MIIITKETPASYKEFTSIEDAKYFGKKYFGSWLKEFHAKGNRRNSYELSELEYEELKEKYGVDYAKKIQRGNRVYAAFSYYCGGNLGLAINQICRFGSNEFGFKKEDLEWIIHIMDNEFNYHEIKENIIVYRSLSYSDLLAAQKVNKICKGDLIVDKGFMGTGLVKSKLLEEHNYDTVVKILVPAGTHAIYLDFISNRVNEQELLFSRGTLLRVLSNKKSILNRRSIICKIV